MSDLMHRTGILNKKHISSTSILTHVTVAEKLVLVNQF